MFKAFDEFRSKYFGKELPYELRVFNVTHLLMCFILLIAIIPIYLIVQNGKAVGIAFTTAVFSLFTFYEANRNGYMLYCSVIMSWMLNFVFFPILFLYYINYLCIIPIYFLFGLIYNNLVMPRKWALSFNVIETLLYLYLIFGMYNYSGKTLEIVPMALKELMSVYIAIAFVTTTAGAAIVYKKRVLKNEKQVYMSVHEDVIATSRMQDVFLVNMSHDIRTPMNAILGNVELMLDRDVNESVKENLYGIYNSCKALLSLTNEMMDLSKSSDQDIVLYNSRYDLRELITEIINMISVRLTDSGIEFVVKIESDIPRYLYSDSGKLRQILINILNNSIKNTDEGSITLSVGCEYKRNNEVDLIFDVTDTGRGIDEKDMAMITGLPVKKNHRYKDSVALEYAGIGLNICREIIEKLDGNINVNSEYGDGTTIMAVIPQQIESEEKIVSVNEGGQYNILIFENNIKQSMHLEAVIKSLSVKVFPARLFGVFSEELRSGSYTHLFISNENYIANREFIEKNIKDAVLVIISDLSASLSLNENSYAIMRPVHLINVANVLNGEPNVYVKKLSDERGLYIPDANILVVDDNMTNLSVAKNLLKKYSAKVSTALSGMEALGLIKENDYDIIFLDHMMPEMDGVDTLHSIRMLPDMKYKEVPVVALTANVVSGAREMFYNFGFDDFIAKPIDTEKLERSLRNLLPKELIRTSEEISG
ncbi:MAG: response regulator [Lachnospiraceae bacterium]|nr:response regulator [Lachnospiraceae bacterium]